MAMEKRNLWSASADANQVEAETILYLPSMSACGRKRKSEFRISSDFDVRFAPGSGRSADKLAKGR